MAVVKGTDHKGRVCWWVGKSYFYSEAKAVDRDRESSLTRGRSAATKPAVPPRYRPVVDEDEAWDFTPLDRLPRLEAAQKRGRFQVDAMERLAWKKAKR